MIININGKDQNLEILHGKKAILTYENIAKMARKDPKKIYTTTYKCGDKSGTLIKGERITVKTDSYPIFNMTET